MISLPNFKDRIEQYSEKVVRAAVEDPELIYKANALLSGVAATMGSVPASLLVMRGLRRSILKNAPRSIGRKFLKIDSAILVPLYLAIFAHTFTCASRINNKYLRKLGSASMFDFNRPQPRWTPMVRAKYDGYNNTAVDFILDKLKLLNAPPFWGRTRSEESYRNDPLLRMYDLTFSYPPSAIPRLTSEIYEKIIDSLAQSWETSVPYPFKSRNNPYGLISPSSNNPDPSMQYALRTTLSRDGYCGATSFELGTTLDLAFQSDPDKKMDLYPVLMKWAFENRTTSIIGVIFQKKSCFRSFSCSRQVCTKTWSGERAVSNVIQSIFSLKNDVYLVVTRPIINEGYGHAMVLAVNENALYFFDPNYGTIKIPRDGETPPKSLDTVAALLSWYSDKRFGLQDRDINIFPVRTPSKYVEMFQKRIQKN
ncbi:MAG: YopT-type cysteine protease domain-containing protein [Chlamydiia bacterium]